MTTSSLCFTVLYSIFVCHWFLGYHLRTERIRFSPVPDPQELLIKDVIVYSTSGFRHLHITDIWNQWNFIDCIIRNIKSTIFFRFIIFISLSLFYKDQMSGNEVFNWTIFPNMLLVSEGNLLETVTKPNEVRPLLPLPML